MIPQKDYQPIRGEEEADFSETEGTRRTHVKLKYSPIATLFMILGVSGSIAIIIIATSCFFLFYQLVKGMEVKLPDSLYSFALLILGYYFGQNGKRKKAEESDIKNIGFRSS